MGFFKKLFGGRVDSPENDRKEQETRNFDMLKYDGVKAMHMGETDYAVKCFNRALEMREDLEVRDYLSQTLIRTGELLPAYEQLQKLAEAEPDNKQIFVRMADVAYMMEDYRAMADACEKAMLIDRDDPQVLNFYARASIGLGDTVNAIAMLTKAIITCEHRMDGEDENTRREALATAFSSRLLRGETLLKTGDCDGADEDAEWAVNHTKDNEDALLLKARVEAGKGASDSAIAYYNKVIEANPFCVAAFQERGDIYLAKGDKEQAEADRKQVIELSPETDGNTAGQHAPEEGKGIQQQVEKAYRSIDPYGIGGLEK